MTEVPFGFSRVSAEEKTSRVAAVFKDVAGSYDLMNDVMSGGMHHLWKSTFVDFIAPQNGQTFLDLAGGTGDITHKIYTRLLDADASGKCILTDINPAMLQKGRERFINAGILTGIDYAVMNAEDIPLKEGSVDVVTIAFGLRNVTHRDQALRSVLRVLKPGGRFLCLEFSHVTSPLLSPLYAKYLLNVIPKLGRWIAGNEGAYQYLSESILTFPTQQALKDEMIAVGFQNVRYTNLTKGIVCIHEGTK